MANYKSRLSDLYARREFQCPVCKEKFIGKRSFKVHYANAHMDRWHKDIDNDDEQYQRWKMKHDADLLRVVFGVSQMNRFRKDYDAGDKNEIPSDVLRYFGLVDKFSGNRKDDKPEVERPVYLSVDEFIRKLAGNTKALSLPFKALVSNDNGKVLRDISDIRLSTDVSGDAEGLQKIIIKSLLCKLADTTSDTSENTEPIYKKTLSGKEVTGENFLDWIQSILEYATTHSEIMADFKKVFIKVDGKKVVSFKLSDDAIVFIF